MIGAVRQFQAAAQLMTTQLTRMTIEVYGAAAGLGTANAALAGFTSQANVFSGSLVAVNASLGATTTAVNVLDQTLIAMKGPELLADSFRRLDTEASAAQSAIDSQLLPAFGDVYRSFGDLVAAAAVFSNAASTTITDINTAVRGMVRTSALSGLSLSGTAAPKTGEGLGPGDYLGMGATAVSMGMWGIPVFLGTIVLGQWLDDRNNRQEREQKITNGTATARALALSVDPTQVHPELDRAQAQQRQIDNDLRELRREAERQENQMVTIYVERQPPRQVRAGKASEGVQNAIADHEAARTINQVYIDALRARPGTPPAVAPAGQAPGAAPGADSVTPAPPAAGPPMRRWSQPAWARPRPRAADPIADMRRDALAMAGVYGRAQDPEEASSVYTAMQEMHRSVTGMLSASGLSYSRRDDLERIRDTLERAAPSLDPDRREVDTRPAVPVNEIKEAIAGVKAALVAVKPVVPPKPSTAQMIGQRLQGAWTDAKKIGSQQVASAGQGFVGLLASFTPLGAVATLLQGVFQGLAPLIDAVKEPLRIVGEIFGKALAPILKAIFPIFKLVAIAATWVGQIFFSITGAILTAIGTLVRGIGRLVNKLPGSPGDPLVKAGQAMIDLGSGFREGARALEEGREQISNMEFGETAATVAEANEQLRNVPEGFKVALARFNAAGPVPASGEGPVAATIPPPPPPPTVVENSPVTIHTVQIVSNNPEQIWRELQPVMERENYRHSGSMVAAA